MKILITRIEGGMAPTVEDNGMWANCFARGYFRYKAGDIVKIPLGFTATVPDGAIAIVTGFQDNYKRLALIPTNSPALFGPRYGGEYYIVFRAFKVGEVQSGTRIARLFTVNSAGSPKMKIITGSVKSIEPNF